MEKAGAYIVHMRQFDVLLLDTIEAFLISATVSVAIFWLLRKVPFSQRLFLPGLGFRNKVRDILDKKLTKSLDPDEAELVGKALIADAIRAAATIIAVILVFSATLQATAPLVMS